MYFGKRFCLVLLVVNFVTADKIGVGEPTCPAGSICVSYERCRLQEKAYPACDDRSGKICCPQSSVVSVNSQQHYVNSDSFKRPPIYSGTLESSGHVKQPGLAGNEKPIPYGFIGGNLNHNTRPPIYESEQGLKQQYVNNVATRAPNTRYARPVTTNSPTRPPVVKGFPYQLKDSNVNSPIDYPSSSLDNHNADYYDNDYYESGYRGPKISSVASNFLRGLDYNEECGVRGSMNSHSERFDKSLHFDNELGLTKFGEFPWQVALLARLEKSDGYGYDSYEPAWTFKFLCGGTVLSPSLVLTAAHCVKGINASLLTVKLGDWNLQGSEGEMFPSLERGIRRVIIHENYNRASFLHDIALLVLNKPVNLKLTPHVASACLLPKKFKKFEEYKRCFIVGWGHDPVKPNYGSNIMKFASVSLIKSECKRLLKEFIPGLSNKYFDSDDVRCIIKGQGKDACLGDGGGAVVCPVSNQEIPICRGGYHCKDEHYFVAGIVSWGSDTCGQDNSINVITNIFTHRDWIINNARPYGDLENFAGGSEANNRFRDAYGQGDYSYGPTRGNDRYANVENYHRHEQPADKYVYDNTGY